MKTTLLRAALSFTLLNTGLLIPATLAQAQEQRPPAEGGRPQERPRGEREGGFMRMNPLVAALDTNGDGIIDEKELANATASLKKLDKNGDGKLTEEELRPNFGRGRGPGGPGGPGGANAEEMVTRLMQFDKNGDGKLSKDELPERMQGMLERGDANKDGFLTKDEIKKLAESENTGGGRRRGEGPEGDGERRRQGPRNEN